MGFLKRLFGLDKKETEDNPVQEVLVNQEEGFCDKECELCLKIIALDRYKKIQGKYYHKKCWKDKVKEVKQQGLM